MSLNIVSAKIIVLSIIAFAWSSVNQFSLSRVILFDNVVLIADSPCATLSKEWTSKNIENVVKSEWVALTISFNKFNQSSAPRKKFNKLHTKT